MMRLILHAFRFRTVILLASFLTIDVIRSSFGVSISASPSSEKKSSSCDDGELYWERTKQCFRNGTQGPCGQNMRFEVTLENPEHGRCDCQLYEEGQRGLIYHPETESCYELFTQGPCSSEETWLILQDNGNPACENNPCLYFMNYENNKDEIKRKEKTWVVYMEECVVLEESSENCNGTISLANEGTVVQCLQNNSSDSSELSLSSGGGLSCPINHVRRGGRCQPVVSFSITE